MVSPQLLPRPARVELRDSWLVMPTVIRVRGPQDSRVLRAAQRLLGLAPESAPGFAVGAAEPCVNVSWTSADTVPHLDADESYQLQIDASGVWIQAVSIWGALHGLTTLSQMVTADGLPTGVIDDAPRHPWRGLMLDPARRFLPVPVLQGVIDGMARLKLNVLHLHLTDDQGFRFQSLHFPRLASEAHYSQTELVELVAFAADRGVRLIPELDMPGHVTSWLTAYPEWGAGTVQPSRRFGVHPACLNPADETVHAVIDTLLGELCSVFADDYVHIGGDEVHSRWWGDHAGVQAYMQARGLIDVAALQADFNRRVIARIEARGRKAVGWDEVLHPDLPAGLLVQSWRGATARDRALRQGHDCVVSSGYYLDLFYPGAVHARYDPVAPEAELLAQEDALLADARFAHVAAGMRWTHAWRSVPSIDAHTDRAGGSGRVLGGEACLWGELVDATCLPGRLWTRLPGLAELWWSGVSPDRFGDQRERWPPFIHAALAAQRLRLSALMRDALALEGIELCEPVKWYARLLGEVALNARLQGSEMPQARPYTADTPLDRAVDFLLPESITAQAVRDMSADALAVACRRWAGLTDCENVPADTLPVLQAVAYGARVVLECLAGERSREESRALLLERHHPHGEYMPAVLLELADRLR